MPNAKAFFTNMRVPMPLHKKVALVPRNNATKIRKGTTAADTRVSPGAERKPSSLPVGGG